MKSKQDFLSVSIISMQFVSLYIASLGLKNTLQEFPSTIRVPYIISPSTSFLIFQPFLGRMPGCILQPPISSPSSLSFPHRHDSSLSVTLQKGPQGKPMKACAVNSAANSASSQSFATVVERLTRPVSSCFPSENRVSGCWRLPFPVCCGSLSFTPHPQGIKRQASSASESFPLRVKDPISFQGLQCRSLNISPSYTERRHDSWFLDVLAGLTARQQNGSTSVRVAFTKITSAGEDVGGTQSPCDL